MILKCGLGAALSMLLLSCTEAAPITRGGMAPAEIVDKALRQVTGWDSLFILDSTIRVDTGNLASDLKWDMQRPHVTAQWARPLFAEERKAVLDLQRASRVRWQVDFSSLTDRGPRPTHQIMSPIRNEYRFVALSPVGFNDDSSLAAIVVSFRCGNRCAADYIAFLAHTTIWSWQLLDTHVIRQE